MSGPTRVLLIEDDEDDYILIQDLFSKSTQSGYELEWVQTYAGGLDAIAAGNNDICILDYRLGPRDGLELLREATRNGCRIPVIILTGQDDYDIDMEAMRIGAADYLIKGQLDARQLERSIRYAIAQQRLQEQIRESGRLISIGTLAAGVAHEVNNPLAVVVGYSELLLAEDLPDPWRSRVQTIFSEAQRAGKIVKNLMRFARDTKIEKRYVDLKPTLIRALDLKSHEFRVNNIVVAEEISPSLPRTMLDEQQILQVIINVLTNAEQACQSFRSGGKIEIKAIEVSGRIRISVIDDGPGIPQELQKRVFEPFFTTKDVGKGTGLGLSISYGIISQHDGDIWVESELGEGAAFHIELPIIAPPAEEIPPSLKPAPVPVRAKHILVVDDEPLIRNLLATYFGKQSFTVDQAQDGEEAWRMLASTRYDCVLLDLKMPGMSGQELFKLIRQSDEEFARKVIFMTGDSVNLEAHDFVTETKNSVIHKPFQLDELYREVSSVIVATGGSE